MITKYCKKLKYQRKIVLVTSGRGELDADGIAQITEKINQDDIGLVVVYALLTVSIYGNTDERIVELTSMTRNTVSKRKLRIPERSGCMCNWIDARSLTES